MTNLQSVVVYVVLLLFVTVPTRGVDCNVSSFNVLATSPTVVLCLQKTNISVAMLRAAPTREQLTQVCTTPSCREILATLISLNLTECVVPLGGGLRLQADLIRPTVAYCEQVDAAPSSSSGGSRGPNDAVVSPAGSQSAPPPQQQKNDTPSVRSPANGVDRPTATLPISSLALLLLLPVVF